MEKNLFFAKSGCDLIDFLGARTFHLRTKFVLGLFIFLGEDFFLTCFAVLSWELKKCWMDKMYFFFWCNELSPKESGLDLENKRGKWTTQTRVKCFCSYTFVSLLHIFVSFRIANNNRLSELRLPKNQLQIPEWGGPKILFGHLSRMHIPL